MGRPRSAGSRAPVRPAGHLPGDPVRYPHAGESEIYEYWAEVPNSQEDIHFNWQVLAVTGQSGIAHWQARFRRLPNGPQVHLDGVLVADFDPEGRCTAFREWWHRQER